MGNQQIHKKFSDEQVIAILENYLAKEISAKEAMAKLELKRSQFFNLAAKYRDGSDNFTIKHKGNSGNRKISGEIERAILKEPKKEKSLIDNRAMPVKFYNYSAVRDDLKSKSKIKVALATIIGRAKKNNYYIAKPERKIHDREVITNLAGELAQHDSSLHQWSPYLAKKFYLITTIDDYSRLLLYAELIEQENVWEHILALKSVFLQYGCPFKYYPDQHAIFRYVKDRDKNRPWNNYTKFTDDIDPQWKRILKDCGVGLTYALSPQAKGKIERPYRWLQDRIVRTAAKEHIATLAGLKKVLSELVDKYNTEWVHSTTKEIPIVRFENALRNKKTLFRPFRVEKPDQTIDDVFCLRAERVVDSYRKISFNNIELKVPGGFPRQTVELRMVPDFKSWSVKIRFWQDGRFLGEQREKLENLPIVRF